MIDPSLILLDDELREPMVDELEAVEIVLAALPFDEWGEVRFPGCTDEEEDDPRGFIDDLP